MFREHIPAGTTYTLRFCDDGLPLLQEPGSYSQGYTDSVGNLDTCTINYSITSSSYTILYSTNNGASLECHRPR